MREDQTHALMPPQSRARMQPGHARGSAVWVGLSERRGDRGARRRATSPHTHVIVLAQTAERRPRCSFPPHHREASCTWASASSCIHHQLHRSISVAHSSSTTLLSLKLRRAATVCNEFDMEKAQRCLCVDMPKRWVMDRTLPIHHHLIASLHSPR